MYATRLYQHTEGRGRRALSTTSDSALNSEAVVPEQHDQQRAHEPHGGGVRARAAEHGHANEDMPVMLRVVGPANGPEETHGFRVNKVRLSSSAVEDFVDTIEGLFDIPPSNLKCRYLDHEEFDLSRPDDVHTLISTAVFRMRFAGTCLPIQVKAADQAWEDLVEVNGVIRRHESPATHGYHPQQQFQPPHPHNTHSPSHRAVSTPALGARRPAIIIDVDEELRRYSNRESETDDNTEHSHSSNGNRTRTAATRLEMVPESAQEEEEEEEELQQQQQGRESAVRRHLAADCQRNDSTATPEMSDDFLLSCGEDEADEEEEDEDSAKHDCLWWMPAYHPISTFFEVSTMVVILVSVASFCLETLPTYRLTADGEERTDDHPTFFIIESVCIAWFTIEYCMRLYAAENRFRLWVWQTLNLIDLVAILPYYIALIIGSSGASSLAVVRILRLLRVTRLLKFSRHSEGLQDMISCMVQTKKQLVLFFLITSVGMVLFGSAIFYCEKDVPDTGFISIPAGFWWAIVTMTTVGYGDISPVTVQGQIVGAIVATLGVVLVAIPAGIFISEFMRLHQERELVQKKLVGPAKAMAELQQHVEHLFEKLEEYNLTRDAHEKRVSDQFAKYSRLIRQYCPEEHWLRMQRSKPKRHKTPLPSSELISRSSSGM